MSINQAISCITAQQVEETARMDFLPTVFGSRLMMHGEAQVYAWMRKLSADYKGGFWQFYNLSNGGFYMAPTGLDKLQHSLRRQLLRRGSFGRCSGYCCHFVCLVLSRQLCGK